MEINAQTRPCQSLNDYSEKCLTEADFNEVIDAVVSSFEPAFAKHGWKLKADKRWMSDIENANYNFESANEVSLIIHGGAARSSEITKDSLGIIVCHELGHVYGFITKEGDPKLYGFEGEADYFAVSTCLQTVIALDPAAPKVTLPEFVQQECRASLNPDFCIRANKAGLSASRMRARILNQSEPSFQTPDPRVVDVSSPNTNAQCGLDTFYAASLGKERPACWYKAQPKSLSSKKPATELPNSRQYSFRRTL